MYLQDVSNETYACLRTLRTQNVIVATLLGIKTPEGSSGRYIRYIGLVVLLAAEGSWQNDQISVKIV